MIYWLFSWEEFKPLIEKRYKFDFPQQIFALQDASFRKHQAPMNDDDFTDDDYALMTGVFAQLYPQSSRPAKFREEEKTAPEMYNRDCVCSGLQHSVRSEDVNTGKIPF